jgi:heme O synthase-like polyprenyltransferase
MLLQTKSRITGSILIFCGIASLVIAAIHQPYDLQSGFLTLMGISMGISGLRTFTPRNDKNVPK